MDTNRSKVLDGRKNHDRTRYYLSEIGYTHFAIYNVDQILDILQRSDVFDEMFFVSTNACSVFNQTQALT